jgi:hypothetical protein
MRETSFSFSWSPHLHLIPSVSYRSNRDKKTILVKEGWEGKPDVRILREPVRYEGFPPTLSLQSWTVHRDMKPALRMDKIG